MVAADGGIIQQQPMPPVYVHVQHSPATNDARLSRCILIYSIIATVISMFGFVQWSCSIPALVFAVMVGMHVNDLFSRWHLLLVTINDRLIKSSIKSNTIVSDFSTTSLIP